MNELSGPKEEENYRAEDKGGKFSGVVSLTLMDSVVKCRH